MRVEFEEPLVWIIKIKYIIMCVVYLCVQYNIPVLCLYSFRVFFDTDLRRDPYSIYILINT